MKLLSISKMDLIQGGKDKKRNFQGYMPSSSVAKDVLKVLCFGPLLASFEDHKAAVKSLFGKKSEDTTAAKTLGSILMTTMLTATYAYASDHIDDIYESYENTPQ